jgi:hypothetical protein
MRERNRFCVRCGHEIKTAARFCVTCGHSVPDGPGQAAEEVTAENRYEETRQAPGVPAHAATVTSGQVRRQEPPLTAATGDRGGSAVPPGVNVFGPGIPPSAQAPPGIRPPVRSPVRPPPRRAVRWPVAAALAVLVVTGGIVAGLFFTGHAHNQPSATHGSPSGQGIIAAVSSPTGITASPSPSPPTGITASPSPSPPTGITASPSPSPPPTQVNIQGVTVGISAVNTDPDAMDVAATLAAYFGGIDARNYTQAWDTYTPALQAVVSLQTFSSALRTSQDTQIVVQSIQHDSNGNLVAQVGFQSHQAGQYGPTPGETCTNWSLDYHLVAAPGTQSSATASPSYLINKVTDVGAGHASC